MRRSDGNADGKQVKQEEHARTNKKWGMMREDVQQRWACEGDGRS